MYLTLLGSYVLQSAQNSLIGQVRQVLPISKQGVTSKSAHFWLRNRGQTGIVNNNNWILNVPKSAFKYPQNSYCSLDVIWDLFESHKGSAMDLKKSRGAVKLFDRKGSNISAHFYVSYSTGLIGTSKSSKLPDNPQDRSVRFFQFQNRVLHQNWPIFGREIEDRRGP